MKRKILVTGGAGFIGSNLCERLSNQPDTIVYSLDNYFTGSEANHVEGVTYIRGNAEDIDELIDISPDYVYHLGEYSRVEQSFEDIEIVWNSNKGGIFSILQFCRKTGAKLIYAGSSTKFGDDGIGRNQSPYAWTKASNTDLVQIYSEWFKTSYAIVYFYNAYGNREIASGKYATLIALYKDRIKKNLPLGVVSPGTQKRNFTHVDDIVNGLILVGEKGYGDGFGIGSPEAFSVLDIAKMFGGEIEILPERKGNRLRADVVTEKTESLGWKPTRSLKDYVAEFLNNLNNK